MEKLGHILKALPPWLMVRLTGHPRELKRMSDFTFPKGMWVHTAFRMWEVVFGRRAGIRPEMASWVNYDGSEGRAFYTWEKLFMFMEHTIRAFFRMPRIVPFKIYLPVFASPQGMPMMGAPYLLAIAYVTQANHQGGSGATLTITNMVVASGNILLACVQTNASTTNTPITGIVFNTSETMTQIITDFNTTSTKVTEDLWQILAPTATTASIVATSSHNPEANFYGTGLAYSGAKTSGLITNSASNKGHGSPCTVTVTGTTSTSWLVGGVIVSSSGTTDSTGYLTRSTGGPSVGDSNGTVAGGSVSMNTTTGAGDDWVFVSGELTVPGAAALFTSSLKISQAVKRASFF